MIRAYVRREGDRREKMAALALSVGVSLSAGAIAYYVARLMISRDAIDLKPPVRLEPKAGAPRLPKQGDTAR